MRKPGRKRFSARFPQFTRIDSFELNEYLFKTWSLGVVLWSGFLVSVWLSVQAANYAHQKLQTHIAFDFRMVLVDGVWRMVDDATTTGPDSAVLLVDCYRSPGTEEHANWFLRQLPFVNISISGTPRSEFFTSDKALSLAGKATNLSNPWPDAIERINTDLLEPSLELDTLYLLYTRRASMVRWSWIQAGRTLILLLQAAMVVVLLVAWRRHHLFSRMQARIEAGLCPVCAYPIPQGTDACPECGLFVPRSWAKPPDIVP